MAIMKCSECGKEVSDKAKVCIGCGAPIKKRGSIKPKLTYRIWSWLKKIKSLSLLWLLS